MVPLVHVPQPGDNAIWIVQLLSMVSGLSKEVLLGTLIDRGRAAVDRPVTIKDIFPHAAGLLQKVKCRRTDIQHYMHVDTFQPTWKAWIFGKGTDASHGTIHYVRGSHRLTRGKMRWLYNRTRTVIEKEPLLSKQNHQLYGPFNDPPPGGGAGAIRYVGFDPRQPHSELRSSLAKFDFRRIEPVVAAHDHQATLVIADTSGLHFRGFAPGSEREQLTLDLAGKSNPEDNVVPRLTLKEMAAYVESRKAGSVGNSVTSDRYRGVG